MPLYRFRFNYEVSGSITEEFENDDEAKAFGWDNGEDNLTEPFFISDVDFDVEDVDIALVDPDGNTIRDVYEDD